MNDEHSRKHGNIDESIGSIDDDETAFFAKMNIWMYADHVIKNSFGDINLPIQYATKYHRYIIVVCKIKLVRVSVNELLVFFFLEKDYVQ